nr:MAG TPA: hypothetical protein [Caudoviricetes sp.]
MYHLSIHKPFILAVFPVSHTINPYTKKVYTSYAGNSTKINPVNQTATAYTFLGITLCNLPIVFVPINVYNKVNLKSKSGGNKHGNQTYG